MRWDWVALDASGQRLQGQMEAESEAAVLTRLRGDRMLPVAVQAAAPASGPGAGGGGRAGRRITAADRLALLQGLATLLEAQLDLDTALALQAETSPHPGIAALLTRLRDSLRRGESLSQALGAAPEVFPPAMRGAVEAGEATASLPLVFAELAADSRRELQIRRKVTGALVYPALLLAMVAAAVLILLLAVMPSFADLLEGQEDSLPTVTRALFGLSAWLLQHGRSLLAGLLGVVLLFVVLPGLRNGLGRWLAQMPLRLPLMGRPMRALQAARVARLLALMLGQGVSLLAALPIAAQAVADPRARALLLAVPGRLGRGEEVAEALRPAGLLPPEALQLVAVGARSGRLAPMLGEAARMLEERGLAELDRLMALLVPVLTLISALIVAGVVGSLVTAIMSVYSVPL